MSKIGRNDLCPCGSGKKFKRCHGTLVALPHRRVDMTLPIRHAEARRVQREQQQGLGRPIVSTKVGDTRFVAVKNTILHSQRWATFHDFLVDYLWNKLGREWIQGEGTKAPESRHPVATWADVVREQIAASDMPGEQAKVRARLSTGADAALMNLAYDIYALEHNAEVQNKLLGRLRNRDNFGGARFEVCVAAVLVRANFSIEFENEDDRTTTHCEFTATYIPTGRKFSVEAKRREGNKPTLGRQLVSALRKAAQHTRIVFIDANLPDVGKEEALPKQLEVSFAKLAKFEDREVDGEQLPPAYLWVLNYPWSHHLNETSIRRVFLFDGFKIPGFSFRTQHATLRQLIESRKQHAEMHALINSLPGYGNVPATFDGDIPQYAFGLAGRERLLVGNRYSVPAEDGSEVVGVLTDAVVMDAERVAYGVMELESGQTTIHHFPLSDAEMDAWRQHPDTFFGVVKQQGEMKGPLEIYDFFLRSFSATPRASLLQLLAADPDLDTLRELSDDDLRSLLAERYALFAIAKGQAESDVVPKGPFTATLIG